VSRREYDVNLSLRHKLIVGEGESDRAFAADFCVRNAIDGFDYAFTGMHSPTYKPSGFGNFKDYLFALPRLAGFDELTDLVLMCDSAQDPSATLTRLRKQIREANALLANPTYNATPDANVVSTAAPLRVHVLLIPCGLPGGLETACVAVAKEHLDGDGNAEGTQIDGWVNTFADAACVGWPIEKRDKLRLQAFISAAWKKKPEMTFSQLFDITADHLIPLTGAAFADIRMFLQGVAAL
jgi:hypothetical protein